MTPLEILSMTFRPIDVPLSVPRVPDRAGVYLLIDHDEIVYVGSSIRVDVRIHAHTLSSGTESKTFDRALWVALPALVHPHYEGAFIRALHPRDNYRAPKSHGYDAEILDGFGLHSPQPGRYRLTRPAVRGPVAERIAAARKQARLSVGELANILGVCRQAVGHWESGRNAPGVGLVEAVATALGIPVVELLHRGSVQ